MAEIYPYRKARILCRLSCAWVTRAWRRSNHLWNCKAIYMGYGVMVIQEPLETRKGGCAARLLRIKPQSTLHNCVRQSPTTLMGDVSLGFLSTFALGWNSQGSLEESCNRIQQLWTFLLTRIALDHITHVYLLMTSAHLPMLMPHGLDVCSVHHKWQGDAFKT